MSSTLNYLKFMGITKILYILIFGLLALLLVLVTLSVGTLLIFGNGRTIEHEREIFEYQSLQISRIDEYVSSGFVSMVHDLGGNEFIFSKNEESYSLISKFGNNEYRCTGLCSCRPASDENDSTQRKGVGEVVSKSMLYLVAALSSTIAYNLAKEYFREECLSSFEEEDSCDPGSVMSEIDECSQNFGGKQTIERTTEKEEEFKEPRFTCQGRCGLHPQLETYSESSVETHSVDKKYGRKRVKVLRMKSVCKIAYALVGMSVHPGLGEPTLENAKIEFIAKKLDPYCRQQSAMDDESLKSFQRMGAYPNKVSNIPIWEGSEGSGEAYVAKGNKASYCTGLIETVKCKELFSPY